MSKTIPGGITFGSLPMGFPRCDGVTRHIDDPRWMILHFREPLTDDQMRVLHEEVKLLEHKVLGFEMAGPKQ